MNYLTPIVVVCLASIQLSYGIDPEFLQTLRESSIKCNERYNLTRESMTDIMQVKSQMEHHDEKCFAGCLLEGLDIIKGNTYDWEYHHGLVLKIFSNSEDRDKAEQIIDLCKNKENEDQCQLGYDIISCIRDHAIRLELKAPQEIKHHGKVDAEFLKSIRESSVKCNENYKLSQETISNIIQMKSHLESENEKCFAGCLLEGIHIIKDNIHDWEYHRGLLVKIFKNSDDLEKAKQVMDTCKEKEKETETQCDLAYDILTCIREEADKHGLRAPKEV